MIFGFAPAPDFWNTIDLVDNAAFKVAFPRSRRAVKFSTNPAETLNVQPVHVILLLFKSLMAAVKLT